MSRKTLFLSVFACLVSTVVVAQEDMTAKKLENPDWYTMVHVQYQPGKLEEALKIVKNHFAPAGKKAGLPGPKLFVNASGKWDATWIWHMEGGITDLNWETSPDDIKWMDALASQEGGMEQATAMIQSYLALVRDFDRVVMRAESVSPPEAEAASATRRKGKSRER